MKLKKLVKKLNKHLAENPQDANLKVTIGKRGTNFYKERSLFLDIERIKRNPDNTLYGCCTTDSLYETETTISIGGI